MKKTAITLIAFFVVQSLFSQTLLETYKTGKINLIEDVAYGSGNDWENIFSGFNDKSMDQQIGHQKKIVVAPDGSVFMSHKNLHQIWKFNPEGQLVSKFGEQGGKPHQFPMLPRIQSVVADKYYFTSDVHSRLKFFDFSGNFVKEIELDYMTWNFQPLEGGKILLNGSVLWKEGWREIVALLDFDSGKERIIHSEFRDRLNFSSTVLVDERDSIRIIRADSQDNKIYLPGVPYFKRPAKILLPTGEFMIANRETGEVKLFNSTGKLISDFKLDIKPIKINEQDVLDNYQKAKKNITSSIERIKNRKDWSEKMKKEYLEFYQNEELPRIEKYKEIANYYPYLPVFTDIIVDNEGNMLVFEFTRKEEQVDNKFSVIAFNKQGEILAKASLACQNYNLKISASTFMFHNGFIYAVCEEKGADSIPLRLVRFKLQGNSE